MTTRESIEALFGKPSKAVRPTKEAVSLEDIKSIFDRPGKAREVQKEPTAAGSSNESSYKSALVGPEIKYDETKPWTEYSDDD